jgi:hypothetical protein
MKTRIFRSMMVFGLAMLLLGEDTFGPGTYKGEWHGGTASGAIHITFRNDRTGGLTPEVGFTLGDQDVVCKVLSFKTDGMKFRLVYEFDAQDTLLQSATDATVKGKTIEGTYKTTAGDQEVDTGTWKATIAP